jgi:hypothetical protein
MGTLVARVNTFVHDTQSSIPIGDTYIGIYFELLSHIYIYLSPKEDRQTDRQTELVYSVLLLGIVVVQKKKKAHSSNRGLYFDLNIYIHRKRERI